MNEIKGHGLVLLGCGKMGSAMLDGWLAGGLQAEDVTVIDPYPSSFLQKSGVSINTEIPANPALVLIAVKPQMMADALPKLQALGNKDTVFVSVAAGISIRTYEEMLGENTPIIRAMPNTPAAISKGITAMVANSKASSAQINMAQKLLEAVGKVALLNDESQMDAVTALSGSGPAYVFHMIETLAQAGVSAGLPEGLSMELAKVTVAGSGELACQSLETPSQLRVNVTSPGGTTEAALKVLMDPENGFPALLPRAINAAKTRSEELSK